MGSDGLRLILAATGASGAACGRHLLRAVTSAERVAEVHFTASPAAVRVSREELDTRASTAADLAREWLAGASPRAELVVHDVADIGARIASGSFAHDGMAVAPCSTATAAHLATGTTTNLVHRAGECALKERRTLLLLVRESPLSAIHLENLLTLTRAGAVVIPLSPPWYHRPRTLDELVEDTCARALDHLGLPEAVRRRWTGRPPHAT
jgi:4-hydroxy-3-polyprenylbenzoate decarboxylase